MADYKTSNFPNPIFSLLFLTFLCLLGLYFLRHPHPHSHSHSHSHSIDFLQLFLSSATNSTLSTYLRALTLHPHIAGTPPSLQTLHYVQTHFTSLSLRTHTHSFDALLSYPLHASLSLHFPNATSLTLPLTEPGHSGRVVDPYHAYSPSGSFLAVPIFVNYGRREDYRALHAFGVSVRGCVAVARRCGDLPRSAVVATAAERGAAAVLMYVEGDGKDDEWVGGVERGTVMGGLGDPLTPGWGGEEGGERLGVEDGEVKGRFPAVPSMPVSVQNARRILRWVDRATVPEEWRESVSGTVGTGTGTGTRPALLNFTYQGEKKVVKIHNVFAVIKGWEEPDRYVLLGNHRDAWTYGAVDPNSGTAALLDIARRYSLLMRKGWAPRRTVVLCSWDAEEFGMVGSTEWVEKNLVNLGSKAVAYLNVDCAVQGPGLFASATPQLDNLLVEVTKKIKDPDSEGTEVYESWIAANRGINIQRLGRVDSDFAPFLQHAGVPSVDLYYGEDYPVYHTAYDSYDWMIKYGDPLFHRHVAVAGIWGLLALRLADDPILPFNYLSYAAQLQEHANILGNLLDAGVSLHPIAKSIEELTSAAKVVEEEVKKLREEVIGDSLLELKRRSLNDRLMLAERGFIDADGLQGRKWFKHLVYGPPKEHDSKLSFFPGVADTISQATRMAKKEGQSAIQHEVWRVARAIQRAAIALRGELI